MITRTFRVAPGSSAAEMKLGCSQLVICTHYLYASYEHQVIIKPGGAYRLTLEIRLPEFGIELALTVKEYDECVKRSIGKTVVMYPVSANLQEGIQFSLMIFQENLDGLVLVQFHFQDQAAANVFEEPGWLADANEVTGDGRYRTEHLAIHGVPW